MSPDFPPYLKSIRATYGKWWQLYTLTDAAGQQKQAEAAAPIFDFGLMVQTIVPKQDERVGGSGDRPDREAKIERFNVLEGLRKYAAPGQKPPHVLLVGRPGSGKSTALARLLLEEAEAALALSSYPNTGREEPNHIPVLVELRYWQGSLVELIHGAIARHDEALKAFPLAQLLAKALLLFDGVNELPSEVARSQLIAFRRDHPRVPMIFTTRDLSLGGDLGIEQKLEMQPLTEAQMQAFVRAYVPEQAEALLRQLKDRLRALGQTPLLLWMLCGLFQQTGEIPENLGWVFRLFTQGYEQRLKQDVVIESDRAWWQPVLQQLAWVMMQGAQPTELRVAIGRKEAVGAIAQFLKDKVPYSEDFARKCLRDLQKHHLIQAGAGHDELEFRHQLIQEYYAAEALLERLPGLSDGELQREYLNYLKWTEPVALMLALVEDEKRAVWVVEMAIKVDFMLGAKLARKTKLEFEERLINLLLKLDIGENIKIYLLENFHSDHAVKVLCNLLNNRNLQWVAAQALGKIGSSLAVPYLIKLLSNTEVPNAREVAATTLGEIGDEAAVPALIESLNDERVSCLRNSLKERQQELYRDIELRAMNTGEYFLREKSARALGKIGSPAAEKALLDALNNSDSYISEEVAYALAEIGSKLAIDVCIQTLNDNGNLDRGIIFYDIASQGYEFYINLLRKGLASDKCRIREISENALKLIDEMEINESSAEEWHSELLQNRSKFIFRMVNSDDKDCSLTDIVEFLGNDPGIHEEACVEILSKLGKPDLLPSLVNLLLKQKNTHIFYVISSIQANCKFYNYDILRSTPALPQPTQPDTLAKIEKTVDTIAERTKQMSDQSQYAAKYAITGNPTIVEGNMEVKGDNVGTKNVYNSFGADDTLLQQITDLQQFITELETQHPHIQTLPEAEAARDQAITKIQATNPTRWQTIRHQMRLLKRQLLNPERHAQAAKATLIEVTKAAWENSLIAKAIITYIDKLSETPDQGA